MDQAIFWDFAKACLPLLTLIGMGAAARRWLLKDDQVWAGVNRLNFFVLIPALVLATLVRADLLAIPGLSIIFTILLALFALIAMLVLYYRLAVPGSMDLPAYTSLFQTTTRWNGAMALAVAGLAFEDTAVTVIAIVMVAVVPFVNGLNVGMMVRLLSGDTPSIKKLSFAVLTNPIVVGALMGIVLSLTRAPLPEFAIQSLEMLRASAIGSILLALGAGLRISGFQGRVFAISFSCFNKLVLMPLLVLLIGQALGVEPTLLAFVVIALAMPSAANGYVIASQMGGDAPLYASCCTTQTLLSFVTVPLWVLFVFSL
ncbi:AEC family transporter [Kiloniella sp. b19]|uniref:AEC family transporter n=1 Tax=Kiloniella sp. GXU_MW_B19 TaxID=3141326 RepID=UPI0031DE3212